MARVTTRVDLTNRSLERHSDASAGDTALTLSTPSGQPRRVLSVTVKYSAAPTQTGVAATLNSGVGAAYDTVLDTQAANLQNNFWQPSEPLILMGDDVLDVLAPAAGGVITSQITINTEPY